MLYIDDQDCDGACHLKNYSFVITYLLEDEQYPENYWDLFFVSPKYDKILG
jgi:hypothetical protein